MKKVSDFFKVEGDQLIILDRDGFLESIVSLKENPLVGARVYEIMRDQTNELFKSQPAGVSLNSIAQKTELQMLKEGIELDMPGYRKLKVPEFDGEDLTKVLHIGVYAGVMGAAFLIGMYHGMALK